MQLLRLTIEAQCFDTQRNGLSINDCDVHAEVLYAATRCDSPETMPDP